MTRARAPYLEWAKNRPAPRIDLAGSNLLACSVEDLPGAREALDFAGDNPNGYPPLLAAIAAHAGFSPEGVATATGAAGANFLACAALLEPGDSVAAEWPGYDPLVGAARMLGAEVRFFERRFEASWAIEPDRVAAAMTPRTKMVIVSDPHNPTGVLAAPDALDEVARAAARAGAMVLVDEVYLETVGLPGPSPPPAAARSPAFVSTSSLTKAYGLSALRCGWALASPPVAERLRRARDIVDGSGSIPAERLSELALRRLPALRARAARILTANRALWRAFVGRTGLAVIEPAGTVAFPRLPDGSDGAAFARRLLEEDGVAVAPGAFFGSPAHFRVAIGGDTARLEEGLAAIARRLGRPAS
ncbi:MAG: pyridoxal phosphate-dependent aminotransferase [Acidobacteriota bacterium]